MDRSLFKQKPRYHGNGFVQIYLTKSHRLHVWHPDLVKPVEHNAQIHNHRYDMSSEVLHGCLSHTLYHVSDDRPSHNAPNSMSSWMINGYGNFEMVADVFCNEIGTCEMVKRSKYTFRTPYFHTSNAQEFTVTLFKIGEAKYPHPIVLAPRGEQPYDAFAEGIAPSEEDLWRAIRDAYRLDGVGWRVMQLLTNPEAA